MLKEFIYFVNERYNIHMLRVVGAPAPWTKDVILSAYRFCNVKREDDRVTKWIHTNWLTPNSEDPDLWFAIYVARVFNLPSTLQAIGYPVPYGPKVVRGIHALTGKTFNGAYIVSTNGVPGSKIEYYLTRFAYLWKQRAKVRPTKTDTLRTFHERLVQFDAIGSFMGAQVVADMKWVWPLYDADDWDTFASSGPGSRRGMNRIIGLTGEDVWCNWNEREWHDTLLDLRGQVLTKLHPQLRSLDCQNLQNCLCEFDKYMRAKSGEGRPKQKFKQSTEEY